MLSGIQGPWSGWRIRGGVQAKPEVLQQRVTLPTVGTAAPDSKWNKNQESLWELWGWQVLQEGEREYSRPYTKMIEMLLCVLRGGFILLPRSVVFKLECIYNHQKCVLRYRSGSHAPSFWLSRSGCRLRICILTSSQAMLVLLIGGRSLRTTTCIGQLLLNNKQAQNVQA